MASVQTKINFVVRKRTSVRQASIKGCEKENMTRGSVNLLTSPSKSALCSVSVDKSKLKLQRTPTKRPSNEENEASPPKLETVDKSPSLLISNISLTSPGEKSHRPAQKELFPGVTRSNLSKARQALHSSTPTSLPEREDKLDELKVILLRNLQDRTSATLYLSGSPGTGKTACINALLADPKIRLGYKVVYVNCTGLKSSVSVFSRIAKDLGLGTSSDKSAATSIEKFLKVASKMTLLVLDEMDQLESRSQKVLYRVFEWAHSGGGKLVLLGAANSLDLTKLLPRLHSPTSPCPPPTIFHFPPYTKKQISSIIQDRLAQAGVGDILNGGALELLAGKVASVSGDIRRALDLSRRVVEVSNQGKVTLNDVLGVVTNVYSTSETLTGALETGESFPLQQKLLISSLLLIKKHSKCKEVNIGKLHEVYKKVCEKRNLSAIDLSEFLSLVQLVETRGILRLLGKSKNRLSKVTLQWDEEEVYKALQDKQLIADILSDVSCLPR